MHESQIAKKIAKFFAKRNLFSSLSDKRLDFLATNLVYKNTEIKDDTSLLSDHLALSTTIEWKIKQKSNNLTLELWNIYLLP